MEAKFLVAGYRHAFGKYGYPCLDSTNEFTTIDEFFNYLVDIGAFRGRSKIVLYHHTDEVIVTPWQINIFYTSPEDTTQRGKIPALKPESDGGYGPLDCYWVRPINTAVGENLTFDEFRRKLCNRFPKETSSQIVSEISPGRGIPVVIPVQVQNVELVRENIRNRTHWLVRNKWLIGLAAILILMIIASIVTLVVLGLIVSPWLAVPSLLLFTTVLVGVGIFYNERKLNISKPSKVFSPSDEQGVIEDGAPAQISLNTGGAPEKGTTKSDFSSLLGSSPTKDRDIETHLEADEQNWSNSDISYYRACRAKQVLIDAMPERIGAFKFFNELDSVANLQKDFEEYLVVRKTKAGEFELHFDNLADAQKEEVKAAAEESARINSTEPLWKLKKFISSNNLRADAHRLLRTFGLDASNVTCIRYINDHKDVNIHPLLCAFSFTVSPLGILRIIPSNELENGPLRLRL